MVEGQVPPTCCRRCNRLPSCQATPWAQLGRRPILLTAGSNRRDSLSLVPHGMMAHLPRAPRRHPTQRSESCGSTESLRLYARRVIQLEGGHSRTFTIVRSQPAIQSPVREARPPRAMVRIQPKRWSDHCQSAAHIKSAGGCGRIRTLRPPHPHSLASASPCMYLWCAYLEAFRT